MSRLRLLLVQPSAQLYGADRAMLSALPELTESFDVTLAVAAPGPVLERARAMGAETIVLPDFALRRRNVRPIAFVPYVVRIARAIVRLTLLHRRQHFDLVYSNSLTALLGPALSRAWRTPHVLHVHECPETNAIQLRALLWSIRHGTDRVVCNSDATRQWVLANAPALTGRTLVVHNGIDLPQPGQPPPPASRLRVSCVGRIHPKKGQGVLLEAAKALADEGVELDLHFYGDHLPEHRDLWEDLLRQVDESALAECVTWHGFIDDTASMYRDHDVAVVPSVLPEEFSLVSVEAQSMRLPVVATGPGGASEVIVDGETGLIVPPRNAKALATALAYLADHTERRATMGELGRARMEAKFSRAPFGRRVRDLCLAAARRHLDPEPGRP
jgi:glycosyltransferase involved in cell wall biosynthesis